MFPYYRHPLPSDSEYLRALEEERAARQQYAAALRAQEEAQQRAARARAARRAYTSPYNSYYDDDYPDIDLDLGPDDGVYVPRQRPLSYFGGQRPYGYGPDPYQGRSFMEEQRMKEMLALEREKERRRLEEERIRRILQEEKQREEAARQRVLEEEQMRRAVEEEKLRRALREEEESRRERDRAHMSSQQNSLEPLLRALGFVPATARPESESEKERNGRQPRGPTLPTSPRRTGTTPSPVRPFPFGQPSPASSTQRPKGATSSPPTTIPISSPNGSSRPAPASPKSEPHVASSEPTPAQVMAAEKIQDAYRAYSSRKESLKSIADIRKRFLATRSAFTLPTTLDYDIPTNGRIPTTVVIDPSAALPSPSLDTEEPFENVPKLAYTPTNAPLHAYEEDLNRILGALDAVESRGDQGVRTARRELARAVEREAERVERWRAVAWNWWTQREAGRAATASDVVPEETAPANVEAIIIPSAPVDAKWDRSELVLPEPQEMEVERSEQSLEPAKVSATEDAPIETSMEMKRADADFSSVSPAPVPELSSLVKDAAYSTPADIPAVEHVPAAHVTEQPSIPEIDTVDETGEAVSPLRAEEVPIDAAVVEAGTPAVPVPVSEGVWEPALEVVRPPTPELTYDRNEIENETEMEVEIEPEEAQTPPPSEHVQLVAEHAPMSNSVSSAEQPLLEKSGSVMDTGRYEFLEHDMF